MSDCVLPDCPVHLLPEKASREMAELDIVRLERDAARDERNGVCVLLREREAQLLDVRERAVKAEAELTLAMEHQDDRVVALTEAQADNAALRAALRDARQTYLSLLDETNQWPGGEEESLPRWAKMRIQPWDQALSTPGPGAELLEAVRLAHGALVEWEDFGHHHDCSPKSPCTVCRSGGAREMLTKWVTP